MALQPPQHSQPPQDGQDPQVPVTPQVGQVQQGFKPPCADKPGIEPKLFHPPKANKAEKTHIANKPPQTPQVFQHYQSPQAPAPIIGISGGSTTDGVTDWTLYLSLEGDYASNLAAGVITVTLVSGSIVGGAFGVLLAPGDSHDFPAASAAIPITSNEGASFTLSAQVKDAQLTGGTALIDSAVRSASV